VSTSYALLFLRKAGLPPTKGPPAAGKFSNGKPAGNTAPPAADAAREIGGAAPEQQKSLVEKHRDAQGSVHTDVLVAAIPLLKGPAQTQARDALTERMDRTTVAMLRDKLQDNDARHAR